MLTVTYDLPYNGLGTDFSQFERPLSFAETYTNRFRNITGGAERRPGMSPYGNPVPTFPNLTRLHELVTDTGNETLMSSDDFGHIYSYNSAATTWSTVRSGGAQVRYMSAEADGKLIFVNGVDRNIYTTDGSAFAELKPLITEGVLAGGSNATTVIDGDISNWIGGTLAANNDIVYNSSLNAYGIVTAIASASLTITSIASAGAGTQGAGIASRNQAAGDNYQLLDYVDLNIIPEGANGFDNVATTGSGTGQFVVAVSGVDFSRTEIRAGDFIYNTTRGAIDYVSSISANVNIANGIGPQVAGDAVAFFKSAMPIASWVHVHFGRTYYLDARNNNRVVISAPDDSQDVTTYQKTLDSTSFNFGSITPAGDALTSMTSFLSYFVAAGKKAIYIYKGTDPIQDSSSSVVEFEAIASYPDGLASRFGLTSNGSDLLYMTDNGLQAVNIGYNTSNTVQNNASVPIRNTLINLVSQVTNTDNIQTTYYPRRAWTINKIDDSCYVLNTNPSYGRDGKIVNIASWHLFNGVWAQQNHYFVRRNGDLYACGNNGLVYQMDSSAATDAGERIATDLTTSWLTLEEPQQTPRIKELKYIRPVFESGSNIIYNITANAGWDNYSSDTAVVSAGGTGSVGTYTVGVDPIGGGEFAQANKYPLRARGEQIRLNFATESSAAPDIITGFTLYGQLGGWR